MFGYEIILYINSDIVNGWLKFWRESYKSPIIIEHFNRTFSAVLHTLSKLFNFLPMGMRLNFHPSKNFRTVKEQRYDEERYPNEEARDKNKGTEKEKKNK